MKPVDDIPLDGIELDDAPYDDGAAGQADDLGIPLGQADNAPPPDAAASYGIDIDSAARISHDNSYDQASAPAAQAVQRRLPPLLRAIATIYQRNASGTLNVADDSGIFMSMFVKDGRILNVAHPDLSSDAIARLLLDIGLVTQRRMDRAMRQSRAAETTLDSFLASSRIVSPVTIHHLVDARCAELLLAVMGTDGVKVSFSRARPDGIRKNCQIPLPWLLKEFRRRESERASILSAIPDQSASFVRTAVLESEPVDELWEDLEMTAAEKQVYFFVDGVRTLDQLSLATGQSRFAVMRAVAGLIRSGDVVATLEPGRRRATRHGLRSSGRALALIVVALAVLAGTGAAVLRGHVADVSEIIGLRSSAWGNLFETAARHRVDGAVLVHSFITTDDEPAPDKLLEHGLILPSDIRAAVSLYRTASGDQKDEPAGQGVDTVGP